MARELILIPKMKYEQLMNNTLKDEAENPTPQEKTTSQLNNDEWSKESKPKVVIKKNEKSKPKADIEKKTNNKSYIQMKPKEFLKLKKDTMLKKDKVKQKWLAFNI